MTRVDFPPPETPVTQVKRPSGIDAVTLFRLLPRAPTILSSRPGVAARRFDGIATVRSPER